MAEQKTNMSDEELIDLIKKSVSEKVCNAAQTGTDSSRDPLEIRWKISGTDHPVQA